MDSVHEHREHEVRRKSDPNVEALATIGTGVCVWMLFDGTDPFIVLVACLTTALYIAVRG